MSYMVNYLKGYLIVNGYLENHRFFVLYDMLKEAFEKENIIDFLNNHFSLCQQKNDIENFIIENNIENQKEEQVKIMYFYAEYWL